MDVRCDRKRQIGRERATCDHLLMIVDGNTISIKCPRCNRTSYYSIHTLIAAASGEMMSVNCPHRCIDKRRGGFREPGQGDMCGRLLFMTDGFTAEIVCPACRATAEQEPIRQRVNLYEQIDNDRDGSVDIF
jgi:phage FluMu protein Com